jgi:hypothetical protein
VAGQVIDHNTQIRGLHYFFVYAGPDRTGTLALELTRQDY